jgi:hypothetical protein
VADKHAPIYPSEAQINRDLLGPLFNTGPKYYVMLAVLLAVTGMVFVAWFFQLAYGIGMAGKNRPSFWGLYITTFVFWIGISHAGTLISAILRVVQAEWRRPDHAVRRSDHDVRAVHGLALSHHPSGPRVAVLLDGPLPNSRYLWPNFQSPLMWDFIAINTYLTGSVTVSLPADDSRYGGGARQGDRLAQEVVSHPGARMARHRARMDTPRKGDLDHGAHHHSRRRVGAHHRVVGLRDDAHADVAQHDFRAVLRRRRDFSRASRRC